MNEPDIFAVLNEVVNEYERAKNLFRPFNSGHEGIAVIREEFLELEREVFWGSKNLARDEAIQLAAMALRFVLDVSSKRDLVQGLPLD